VIDISALLRSQDYGLKNETHLEEERWKVSKEIGRACETIGFFAISNHGVDPSILDAAWNVTRDFFDLPSHQKRSLISHDTAEYPYGYEASESLSRGKKQRIQPENTAEEEEDHPDDLVDWKETFAIGPKPSILNGMPARQFPQAEPKEMRSAYELYFEAMEHLTMHLLGAFAMALDLPHDNEKHWFHDKMDHHMCALRALNYPHVPHDTLQNAPPGQWRAGPHTDYGALTILKSGGPGLQVLAVHKNDNDDNDPTSSESYWVDVPYMPDKFIINIGDMMQRWTNGMLFIITINRISFQNEKGVYQIYLDYLVALTTFFIVIICVINAL
jgi:isopenicillin N synthase-like dioxygenase